MKHHIPINSPLRDRGHPFAIIAVFGSSALLMLAVIASIIAQLI